MLRKPASIPETFSQADSGHAPVSHDITWHSSRVSGSERAKLLGVRPLTVWLTGLSGSGKSTLALLVERRLVDQGQSCYVLDGDNLRHGLNRDLGFSPEDRHENIRRAAEVARLMNDAGLVVITAFISPYRADREMARRIVGEERFIEVYLSADVAACERRDVRGLYARARRGEIRGFTGIDSPYEEPRRPDVAMDTGRLTVTESIDTLFQFVVQECDRT